MIRSLYTASTGMNAQDVNVSVISNNLANVNTTGFKRSRAEFQDLLYQNLRLVGTLSPSGQQVPTGAQLGLGVKTASIQKVFIQGDFTQTQNPLDIAIQGKGFFTFYGGHDPEDYQHRVGDAKTELELHPNSPGYRLILNNVLFPAAKKKKQKT